MRQKLRRVIIVVGFLMALGSIEKIICPNAEASYSVPYGPYGMKDVPGTVGIAAGIGSVIGLSTIAFYDSPTAHFKNVLVGAGAGVIVGLGVAAYLLSSSPEHDDIDPQELLPSSNRKDDDSGGKPSKNSTKTSLRRYHYRYSPSQVLASVPETLAISATRQWVVGLQVLELRF